MSLNPVTKLGLHFDWFLTLLIASPSRRHQLLDTVATVRLELDDWTGRFTDLLTLLKVDGEWKIMNRVFHLHA